MYGDWKSYGYILPRKNGKQMFMWLYKVYNDPDVSRQTDLWQHLIY